MVFFHYVTRGLETKNIQTTLTSPEEDASTADKSTNQDDAQCMVKGVMDAARQTTLKWYAEGPRPAQSMLLRKKTFRSKKLVSRW